MLLSTKTLGPRSILEEIEVVENQEDGQKNIDNHSRQHYNVEQFCVISHSFDLVIKSDR